MGAHTSQFGSGEVLYILRFTPAANSEAHTLQFGSSEVSCLLRFTPSASLGAHTSQFGSGGLILYCSRIRKNVTHRQNKQTEKREERTENREINYRGHSIAVLMERRVERANIQILYCNILAEH